MNIMRKAVSALGGILLAALLIAALAPKAARGIAAALIRDEDQPARHAFTASCEQDSGVPTVAEGCSFNVPAGGELVIETISISGFAEQTHTLLSPFIQITTAGTGQIFALSSIADNGGSEPIGSDFQSAQAIRFYADPGSTISFIGSTPQGSSLVVVYRVSGYIVSLP
jgi:hypothetical protein